jgi:hypothetical protein
MKPGGISFRVTLKWYLVLEHCDVGNVRVGIGHSMDGYMTALQQDEEQLLKRKMGARR